MIHVTSVETSITQPRGDVELSLKFRVDDVVMQKFMELHAEGMDKGSVDLYQGYTRELLRFLLIEAELQSLD